MNKKKFKIDWGDTLNKIKESENSSKNSFKDERMYYPQFKDNGTASAVIRFLPSPDTDIPFTKVYTHSVRGPGGWYIENCPTTIKKDCPACKANSEIWDSDPDTARARKRKQNFYSNILVVKDPVNPENEGKVFLFRYGFKIHQKIMEMIQPEDPDVQEPVMVFDYYEGANFKLIIKKIKVGKVEMPNYDSSKFEGPSALGTDEEIEKINDTLYSLSEFTDVKNFKSYEDLGAKFSRVVGSSNPKTTAKNVETTEDNDDEVVTTDENNVFDGDDDSFFEDLKKDD